MISARPSRLRPSRLMNSAPVLLECHMRRVVVENDSDCVIAAMNIDALKH